MSQVEISSDGCYYECKPILIACTAATDSSLEKECSLCGFDRITQVPLAPDFLSKLFQEIEKK